MKILTLLLAILMAIVPAVAAEDIYQNCKDKSITVWPADNSKVYYINYDGCATLLATGYLIIEGTKAHFIVPPHEYELLKFREEPWDKEEFNKYYNNNNE